jgi:hypothetical protein
MEILSLKMPKDFFNTMNVSMGSWSRSKRGINMEIVDVEIRIREGKKLWIEWGGGSGLVHTL